MNSVAFDERLRKRCKDRAAQVAASEKRRRLESAPSASLPEPETVVVASPSTQTELIGVEGSSNPTIDPRPSIVRNEPRGIAMKHARTCLLEQDQEIFQSGPANAYAESLAQSAFQILHVQDAWLKKTQYFIGKIQAGQTQLSSALDEVERLKKENEALKFQLEDQSSTARLAETEILRLKADLSSATTVALEEGKKKGVEEFLASASFLSSQDQLKKQVVQDYKKSTEGQDWVENRAVEYCELGFTRCQLQFEQSGLLPADADLSFLAIDQGVPGEYELPPFEVVDEETA